MLNLGTAAAKITLDISDLTSKANKANTTINGIGAGGGKNLDTLTGKVNTFGASIQKVSAVTAGFGLAVTGAFAIAAKGAIGFDGAMGNVNSIAQLTKGQLADLTNQVLDLSKATGQAPTTLADGLYDIESSGFAGADALKILTAAANAANAGLSDTGTSAAVITAVLNSYSLGADQAGHASDVLFQTVNDGVVTFGQLSQYMGQTLPIASALNVPIEQLGASYALMTKNGLPVAETQTDINALLTSALNPTSALTTAVQKYGYANAESLIKSKGLPGFLDFLTTASGGSATALTDLLGTQNASAAAMLLMKDNGKQYTDELDKMNHASDGLGATQTALNKQQETTAFKLKQLAAAFSVLQIKIGQQLEPVINTVAEGLTKLFNVISGLPTPVLAAIAAIGGVVGVVALVAGSIGLALPKILEMKQAFGEVLTLIRGASAAEGAASSFSLLSPPILLVTAAIIGLGIAYKTNFLGFADGVRSIGSDLTDTWNGLTGGISNFIDNFGLAYDAMAPVKGVAEGISAGFKTMKQTVDAVGGAVGKVAGFLKGFNGAADSTKKSLDGVTGPAKSVGDAVNGLAKGVNGVTDAVNPFNVGVGSATKHIQALYGTATGLARVLLALSYAFGQIGGGKFTWANDISAGLLKAARYTQLFQNYFKAAFGGNAEKLLKTLPGPLQGVAHGVGTLLDTMGDFKRAYDRNGLLGVAQEVPRALGNAGTAARRFFTGVGDLFRLGAQYAGPFAGAVRGIGSQFDDLGRIIQDVGKAAGYVLKGDFSTAMKWGEHAVTDFGSLVRDQFVTIGATLTGLGTAGISLGSWVLNTVAPTITGWIADNAGNVWNGITGIAGWVWNGIVDLGQIALNIGGWLVGLAGDALDLGSAIKKWITDTALPAVAGAATDIGKVLVSISDWAVDAIGKAVDIGKSIASWVKDTALPAVAGAAVDIGKVLVSITDWGVDAIVDLGKSIGSWVKDTALPAVAGAAVDIGKVLVSISDWAVDALTDIGTSVGSWIKDTAWPAVSGAATDIGKVLVSIGDWAVDALKDIGASVGSWITGTAWPAVSSVATNIPNVAVSIVNWLVSAGAPLGDAIGKVITSTGSVISGTSLTTIESITVTVANWVVDGTDSVVGAIGKKLADADYSPLGAAISFGIIKAPFDIGKGLADAIIGIPGFIADIAKKFSTADYHSIGVAIGHGLLLIAISPFVLPVMAASIIVGFVSEMVKKASQASTYADLWNGFSDGVTAAFKDIAALATGIFDGFWDPIETSLDKVLADIKQKWGDTINTLIGYLNKLPGVSIGTIDTPKVVREKLGQHAVGGISDVAQSAVTDPRIPRIVQQSPTGTLNGPSKNGRYTDYTKDAQGNYTVPNPGDYFTPEDAHAAAAAMKKLVDAMQANDDKLKQIRDKSKDNVYPKGPDQRQPTMPGPTGAGGVGAMGGFGENAAAIAAMQKNLQNLTATSGSARKSLADFAEAGVQHATAALVGATAATGLTQSALDVLGRVHAVPKISQVGAEDVTKSAGLTEGALESIPTAWKSFLSQSGAEAVTGAAGITEGALRSIPVSWFTSVTQQGAETVRDKAYDAASALFSIPDSRFSTVDASVSGIGDVLALANAIDAVHSVTAYVNVVTTGGLNAVGKPQARGGYTDGVLTLMAEEGPELLRYPDGSMGLAREKAYYAVPAHTYVFTAPRTKNMLAGMDGAGPIPAYARGGYVRPWRAAVPTSVPTQSASRPSQTIIYRTTVVQALKSDELQHLMEQAEAGSDLATNLGPALTQIRQTASTPTVGRR